jgi:hypothetical protein
MQEDGTVTVHGMIYRILRERRNRRSACAIVKNNEIIITIPQNAGYFQSNKLFLDLKGRIIKKLERRRNSYPGKSEISFADRQIVKIRGREFSIDVVDQPSRKTSSAKLYGNVVRIKLAEGLSGDKRGEHITKLARRAISNAFMPELLARIGQINSEHFGSKLGKVRFKDNVSNWGSLSGKNNLNLDFRILLAPDEIMDAILCHELAHTRHRNHSKEFYGLLLGLMPDYRKRMHWLRSNADRLRPGEEMPEYTVQ